MIEQSISAVFQRDSKVVIPDFGAIIYSEATTKTNFIKHLTFDDGKIIEEFRKQAITSEEEAKNKLERFVEDLKTRLLDKGCFYLGGIGYLFLDEAKEIQFTKSKDEHIECDEVQSEAQREDDEVQTENIESSVTTEIATKAENELEDSNSEFSEVPVFDITDDKKSDPEAILESNTNEVPYYLNVLSKEDDRVQDYYTKRDRYFNKNKKRKRIPTAILVLTPILLITMIGMYMLKIYQSDIDFDLPFLSYLNPKDDIVLDLDTAKKKAEITMNEIKATAILATHYQDPANTLTEIAELDEMEERHERPSVKMDTELSYSIILGSFKEEHNATRYVQLLKKRGLDVSKFGGNGGYHFVGIDKINNKSNASQMLIQIQENHEPSAWLAIN